MRIRRPTSTRGRATGGPTCASSAAWWSRSLGRCDAIVFLQTIEHIDDPGALLERLRPRGAGRATSRPRTGSRSPPRAPRNPTTPGICASTRRPSTGELLEPRFTEVELSGSFTPASCACTSSRSASAGTGSTRRCGSPSPSTSASLPRSRPRTSCSARGRLRPRLVPSTSSQSAARDRGQSADRRAGERRRRDLAIVLHSHMPYVEGFGTYPFGEEWLFDAVIRSYVRCCDVGRGLTMTVTPVLADQLEDPGVAPAACSSSCAPIGSRRCDADAARRRGAVPRRMPSRGVRLPPRARAARDARR